jgi:hypothetical protein
VSGGAAGNPELTGSRIDGDGERSQVPGIRKESNEEFVASVSRRMRHGWALRLQRIFEAADFADLHRRILSSRLNVSNRRKMQNTLTN